MGSRKKGDRAPETFDLLFLTKTQLVKTFCKIYLGVLREAVFLSFIGQIYLPTLTLKLKSEQH